MLKIGGIVMIIRSITKKSSRDGLSEQISENKIIGTIRKSGLTRRQEQSTKLNSIDW